MCAREALKRRPLKYLKTSGDVFYGIDGIHSNTISYQLKRSVGWHKAQNLIHLKYHVPRTWMNTVMVNQCRVVKYQ